LIVQETAHRSPFPKQKSNAPHRDELDAARIACYWAFCMRDCLMRDARQAIGL